MPTLQEILEHRSTQESLRKLFDDHLDYKAKDSVQFSYVASRRRLESTILSKLGELHVCTLDDLHDEWCTAISEDPSTFDAAYARFSASIVAAASLQWRSDPLALPECGNFKTLPGATIELWSTLDGRFSVEILGSFPAAARLFFARSDEHSTRVFLSITAKCTERRFRIFCDSVIVAAAAILKAIKSHNNNWVMVIAQEKHSTDDDILNSEAYRRLIAGRNLWPADIAAEFLPVDSPNPQDHSESSSFYMLHNCLKAYFSEDPAAKKGDTLDRRLKMATHLLVESYSQLNDAIGLALAVAAIESLLCRKGDNLSQMFAQNMAVLLEPDLQFRVAAERWCKDLYDKRSGVLHGSRFDSNADDTRNARSAALAVIKAFFERRDGIRGLSGEVVKPEEFFNELASGKYGTGTPLFVEETPVNSCWRHSKPNP